MGDKVRIRCPLCGMLVWQNRLNKDYPFEFVIQTSTSGGYQKINTTYKKAYTADTEGAEVFQALLAMKMISKAEELLQTIDQSIKIDVQFPDDVKEELTESYEKQTEKKRKKKPEYDVELEKDYVYELQVDGEDYEIEVPYLKPEDTKRISFWRRLWKKEKEEIEDMTVMADIEYEADYEVETLFGR